MRPALGDDREETAVNDFSASLFQVLSYSNGDYIACILKDIPVIYLRSMEVYRDGCRPPGHPLEQRDAVSSRKQALWGKSTETTGCAGALGC